MNERKVHTSVTPASVGFYGKSFNNDLSTRFKGFLHWLLFADKGKKQINQINRQIKMLPKLINSAK
jgi:hypothetical protein